MKFLDYIGGNRRGKEANRIERDAMKDPFLSEAIEGFDSIDDNHTSRINELQSKLKHKKTTKKDKYLPLRKFAAAGIIIALTLGGYLLLNKHQSDLYAQSADASNFLEIYVPEIFYEENIEVIEETNVALAEYRKPTIENFKVNEVINATLSEKERESLSQKILADNQALDIYIPNEYYERNINTQRNANIPSSSNIKEKVNSTPQPLIGFEKYNIYLKTALIHPTDDVCKDRHGKVAIDFRIDSQGNPYDFEVVYSLCGTSDKEAIRLIQNGSRWTTTDEKVRVKVEF